MEVLVSDWYTDIFLSSDEAKELCKPGAGAETCSWLLVGWNGWECCCLHKLSVLVDLHEKGTMSAMRDGCDAVRDLDVVDLGIGKHTVNILAT